MTYSHKFGGEQYNTNVHNHTILGMTGCDVTEKHGQVIVDFSKVDMPQAQIGNYVDALRGVPGMSCSQQGRELSVSGECDFRSVSNVIAQKAVDLGDALGQRFVEKVKNVGDKIDPHAAHQSFTSVCRGVSPVYQAPQVEPAVTIHNKM